MAKINDLAIVIRGTGIAALLVWALLCSINPIAAAAAGSASIDFSVMPNPLSVEIISSRPTVNYRSKITASIINRGDLPLKNVSSRLESADDLIVRTEPRTIKELKPRSSKEVSWLVSTSKPGDYDLKIMVEGVIDGFNQPVSAETNISVTFLGAGTKSGVETITYFVTVFSSLSQLIPKTTSLSRETLEVGPIRPGEIRDLTANGRKTDAIIKPASTLYVFQSGHIVTDLSALAIRLFRALIMRFRQLVS